MLLALFVISLYFSALISILYLVPALSRLSTGTSGSCSSSARASSENNDIIGVERFKTLGGGGGGGGRKGGVGRKRLAG